MSFRVLIVEQNCRLNLSEAAAPDVDKALKSCVSDEQQAHDQLQRQWSQIPGEGRAGCAPQNNVSGPKVTSFYSLVSKRERGCPRRDSLGDDDQRRPESLPCDVFNHEPCLRSS